MREYTVRFYFPEHMKNAVKFIVGFIGGVVFSLFLVTIGIIFNFTNIF